MMDFEQLTKDPAGHRLFHLFRVLGLNFREVTTQMAEEEQLNCEMLECLCLAIIEEKGIGDHVRTKKLLAFMLSGKEPFNVVLDVLRRVDHLCVCRVNLEKGSNSVRIGDYFDDRCLFGNLPSTLLNILLEYSKKVEFYPNIPYGKLPLHCLARNKRLETIVFSRGYLMPFLEWHPVILDHVNHVKNIECPLFIFRDILQRKMDVGFIQAYLNPGDLSCLYHALSPSNEFSGLTRLKFSLPGNSIYWNLEREMPLFKFILSHCERIFPYLRTLEFVFFTRVKQDHDRLTEHLSVLQDALNSYTGRLKILVECIFETDELKYFIDSFDGWVSRVKKRFPDYVCGVVSKRFPFVVELTKSMQLLPNVELNRIIRCQPHYYVYCQPPCREFSNEFKLAEEVFKETYELFNDPGYNSKTGWKLDKESATTGKVYTKPYKNGVIFALSASVAYTADTVFKTTVTEFEKIPTWNANVTQAEVIARISDNVDIFRYANPDILLVKSRDFVAVQANRKIGDTIYIAARSVDIDQAKESKKHVRGRINLGCSRISADGPNAKIEYLLAIDFGGSVPTSIVNKALSHIIMKDFKELQKHLDATH